MTFTPETIRALYRKARELPEEQGGQIAYNILEILENMPPGPEERIEYLTPDWVKVQRANLLASLARQIAGLERALNSKAA